MDDQLVLNIKGTLSVVELKILRQRLLAGTYHKASKGELCRMIAPGYALDAVGRLVKDPNQRVEQAIALVFTTFPHGRIYPPDVQVVPRPGRRAAGE